MSPRSPQSPIAGLPRRAAVRGHDAGQRRTPVEQLRDLSDDVDQLLRLESVDSRNAVEVERKIALVEKIAAAGCALRQHYRGPSSQPCRPPIKLSVDGLRGWW